MSPHSLDFQFIPNNLSNQKQKRWYVQTMPEISKSIKPSNQSGKHRIELLN